MRAKIALIILVIISFLKGEAAHAGGGLGGFAQGFASGGATILNDPDRIKSDRLDASQQQITELQQLSLQTDMARATMQQHVKNLQAAVSAYNETK